MVDEYNQVMVIYLFIYLFVLNSYFRDCNGPDARWYGIVSKVQTSLYFHLYMYQNMKSHDFEILSILAHGMKAIE